MWNLHSTQKWSLHYQVFSICPSRSLFPSILPFALRCSPVWITSLAPLSSSCHLGTANGRKQQEPEDIEVFSSSSSLLARSPQVGCIFWLKVTAPSLGGPLHTHNFLSGLWNFFPISTFGSRSNEDPSYYQPPEPCTVPTVSQTFINGPFIKPSTDDPTCVCHPFLKQTLTDTPTTCVSLFSAPHHCFVFFLKQN